METKYKISDNARAFLAEYLPEALAAETSFAALSMLYALIDGKGFEARFSDFSVKHLPDARRLEWLESHK